MSSSWSRSYGGSSGWSGRSDGGGDDDGDVHEEDEEVNEDDEVLLKTIGGRAKKRAKGSTRKSVER